MKKWGYIISAFSLLLCVLAFTNPEKKIEKLVKKVWKGTALSTTKIELDSTIENITELRKIHSLDKTYGFAVYTYSHGCKVGGCSAPGDDVDDSYEIFEYIVIYDVDLTILKLDIANYGGEYGYEICRSSWLKQFEGSHRMYELNQNIDGISGATVSASYLIDDVNILMKTMKQLKKAGIIN